MIGYYRYEIDILETTRRPDGAGGARTLHQPIARVWSAIEQLPAAAGDGPGEGRLRRIKAFVRNRIEFALGRRIRWGGDDYEIVSIESDDERGRRVFLICEERR
jgi:head-tail adaptor